MLSTRTLTPVLIALALLGFTGVANAQEPAPSPFAPPGVIRNQIQQARENFKGVKQNFVGDLKHVRATTKDAIKNASTSDEKRVLLDQARDAKKNLIETRRASTTELRNRFRDMAHSHFNIARERFGLGLKQFDHLVVRIESRMKKLQSEGVDVSTVQKELDEAKRAIEQARADVKAVADLIANVKDSDDPSSFRGKVAEAVRKAVASMKAAHQALKEAVRALVAVQQSTEDDDGNE